MQNDLTAQTIHRGGFLFLSIAVLVFLQLDVTVNESILIKVLAIGVLFAGIPHGAIDPVIAKRFGVWKSGIDFVLFLLTYLAVTGLMIGAWVLAPTLTLTIFLLLSVWHFSGDWLPSIQRKECLWISLSILTLPALFHSAQVTEIFRLLTSEDSTILVSAMVAIAPVASLLAIYSIIKASSKGFGNAVEIVVLMVCAAAMPPLWFFLVYFCFLHSPRHILKTLKDIDGKALLNTALFFTAITLVLAVVAVLLLPVSSLDERILKVVFVGLFALTVPHMILNDFFIRVKADETHQ